VDIIPAETIRAEDGLALSSRNGYLTTEERTEAPHLQRILQEVRDQILNLNERSVEALNAIEQDAISQLTCRGWSPDYIAIRQQSNLAPSNPESIQSGERLVVLTAAKLGKTRLIDNLEID
jgi:pantoate--beta-alanine ligase